MFIPPFHWKLKDSDTSPHSLPLQNSLPLPFTFQALQDEETATATSDPRHANRPFSSAGGNMSRFFWEIMEISCGKSSKDNFRRHVGGLRAAMSVCRRVTSPKMILEHWIGQMVLRFYINGHWGCQISKSRVPL